MAAGIIRYPGVIQTQGENLAAWGQVILAFPDRGH